MSVKIKVINVYVDDNLIDAHIEHFDKWLNIEYFNNDQNIIKFINKFVNIVVNYCYCIKDLRAMLNVLEILEFNEAFSDLLTEHNKFNMKLMMIIFISYGYPFKLNKGGPNPTTAPTDLLQLQI